MLYIKEIKKSFGSFEVLDIPSLQLDAGNYWIKGVNGSGKSTFFKILAGLLPFKGDIVLNNNISIIKNPVRYRQLVNHAPAEPVYPSFVSGQQLIDFFTRVKGSSPEQVKTLKEMLSIDNYINNPTGSYSSGMLKKLSLLLAFIGNPEWILLDEPFTTLDTLTQAALQQLIREKNDTSFILTSHHDISLDKINFMRIFTIHNKTIE
jgi:ABC-2 type transport system ATP-binding protein